MLERIDQQRRQSSIVCWPGIHPVHICSSARGLKTPFETKFDVDVPYEHRALMADARLTHFETGKLILVNQKPLLREQEPR